MSRLFYHNYAHATDLPDKCRVLCKVHVSNSILIVLRTRDIAVKKKVRTYGENLIARCSQVHDNFTMGVNRKILINLIYLFIQETYLTCANGL